ncbi:MAG: MFS transporter [Candidatus Thermoplasmatota archaeon]|nr:MFS transporter [Candidatus Thermoplasmatota archaeon]
MGWNVKRDLQLLSVGTAIRTFGAAIYNPFLALFLFTILHVDYLEIGVIFVGLGVLQVPFGLFGGLWTDRVGRRRLIILSLLTEALFTAVLAYAFQIQSLALAIATAGFAGIILSATGPAFSAYIADWGVGSGRTMAFTWFRISFNAGFAAGVAIGGLLVTLVGFPEAVAISAVIIGMAAVFMLAFLGPSPYDLALREGRPVSQDKATVSQKSRSMRESFSLLVADRPALLTAFGFALVWLTASQWSVTFPLFVHNKLGISYAILGIGLALNGLVVVVGQFSTTRLVLGMRHTTIAILGGGLYVVAYLMLGFSAFWVLFPAAIFLVSVLVLTLGENLGSIPTSTLPSNLAPPGEIGAYNGAFGAFLNTSALGAIFLGGVVLATVANPLMEWVVMVLPAFPGFVLLKYAGTRIPAEKDRA